MATCHGARLRKRRARTTRPLNLVLCVTGVPPVNWEAIGAVGDLISGVAVLLTLLYLAIQLRQAKNLMSSTVHQSRADRNIELAHFSAQDEQGLQLATGELTVEELNPKQLLKASLVLSAILRHFEDMQYQYELNVVDETTWRANLGGIRGVLLAGSTRELWPECKHMFREEFVTLVESMLEEVA